MRGAAALKETAAIYLKDQYAALADLSTLRVRIAEMEACAGEVEGLRQRYHAGAISECTLSPCNCTFDTQNALVDAVVAKLRGRK